MNLPKYKKTWKPKTGICAYPECNREYFSHFLTKYCDFHKILAHRKRLRKVDPPNTNRIIKHSFNSVQTAIVNCELETCKQPFEIKIFPRQYTYPKFCELHRNHYRNGLAKKEKK
jgi:hypothetical protein